MIKPFVIKVSNNRLVRAQMTLDRIAMNKDRRIFEVIHEILDMTEEIPFITEKDANQFRRELAKRIAFGI